ncbi:hypothetical protein niasHT_024594 [Heterodera trifolii]|uniref:Lethal giant larvae homologue 2 domain-containing protein n=1 Tax=Heterodera trifolii TaxID=157864 RepID=A0ABD2K7G8_9BILA
MDRARRRLASAIDGIKAQFTDGDSEDTADLPSTANSVPDQLANIRERVEPAHCQLSKIVRHGFPDSPKCMAYDPVQKLCAIGSGNGCVRLFGQAGVDQLLKHESDEPVTHLQFLINEGGLVSALQDDTLHLWNFRQRIPEIAHSLRMSKERISTIYLPFQSRWLYVGTEKGNIYFVCLATFELSTYIIQWNKAVDMSCRTHPGAIKSLEVSPVDPTKLLIVFDRGQLVLWNIQTREVDRFRLDDQPNSPVTAVSWHFDGKQLMAGHHDGSLSIWNVKKPHEMVQQSVPHGAMANVQQQQQQQQKHDNHHEEKTVAAGGDQQQQQNQQRHRSDSAIAPAVLACKPITQLSWSVNSDGDQMIIFAGGMPMDEGALPSVTVMRAKGSLTVLEMDHPIVSMLPLHASPYASAAQHPHAMVVLLRNDLLVVDMQAQGYPCFEVPHPMDLHESPVTMIKYFSDCPVELIAALTLVGRNQRRQGVRLSERPWPLNGGIGRECATGQQEMLLTGHEDGSIKFWQASSEQLQIMYKLKTGRHFEKNVAAHIASLQAAQAANGGEEKALTVPVVSHAVADVELCLDSRQLLVASRSGQVTLFLFAKTECCQEIATLVLPQLCRSTISTTFSPTTAPPSPKNGDQQAPKAVSATGRLKRQSHAADGPAMPSATAAPAAEQSVPQPPLPAPSSSRNSSHSTDTSFGSHCAELIPLKVRGGALRRPAGYQPELVCQIPWINGIRPELVTALALNSAHGLIALGTRVGFALIDAHTAAQVYAWSNDELLGREPIPYWSSALNSQIGEMTISPATELAPSVSSTANSTPRKRHPLARALSIRSPCIKQRQFSAQNAPKSPPPVPPAPQLSRHNTTDSTGSQPSTTFEKIGASLNARLQRPQLIKAFTYNPTQNSSGNGDGSPKEFGAAGTTSPPQSAGLVEHHSSTNCNGRLSSDSRPSSPPAEAGTEKQQHKIAAKVAGQSAGDGEDDQGEEEHVCSLQFINSPAIRRVPKLVLCLWLGTSAGAVVAFQLQVPTNRTGASLTVTPSGRLIRLKGTRFLCSAFFDRSFCLLAGPTEQYKQMQQQQQQQNDQATALAKDGTATTTTTTTAAAVPMRPNKVITKASLSPVLSSSGTENVTAPATTSEDEFQQLALFVSDFELRTVQLPSYQQLSHRAALESEPLLNAHCSHISGHPTIVTLTAKGNLLVLSLPSLRILLHVPLIGKSIDMDSSFIFNRFDISEHGLGFYAVSHSEVQKFTVSAEITNQVNDCMGELFVPCDMPEAPKHHSFLRGILAAGASAVSGISRTGGPDQMAEMDTLLREKPPAGAPGSMMRTVARPMVTSQQQQQHQQPQPQQQLTGTELGTSRTISAAQAAQQAIQNLGERGDRLNSTVDATEQLRNNAQAIQSRSAKLLEKYEKRKWYQL